MTLALSLLLAAFGAASPAVVAPPAGASLAAASLANAYPAGASPVGASPAAASPAGASPVGASPAAASPGVASPAAASPAAASPAASASVPDVARAPSAGPRVILTTALGDVEVELDAQHAPITTRNFLRYVEAGRYDGGGFHRTVRADNQPRDRVKIAVVQGGVGERWAEQDFPPIPLEATSRTGLKHVDGTISMARAQPDSATSDFFICVGAQPELDEGGHRNPDGRGFAAFGRVVRGMEVVRRIHAAPAKGQSLEPPIRLMSARVVNAVAAPASPAP